MTVGAQAQNGEISGNGTADNPYLIASADDLAQMRDNVNANATGWRTAHYRLTADINLKGIDNWTPIGSEGTSANAFQGVFDGRAHSISNLKIDKETRFRTGLFGNINGATVRNVALVNVDIKGQSEIGGIAGAGFTPAQIHGAL